MCTKNDQRIDVPKCLQSLFFCKMGQVSGFSKSAFFTFHISFRNRNNVCQRQKSHFNFIEIQQGSSFQILFPCPKLSRGFAECVRDGIVEWSRAGQCVSKQPPEQQAPYPLTELTFPCQACALRDLSLVEIQGQSSDFPLVHFVGEPRGSTFITLLGSKILLLLLSRMS